MIIKIGCDILKIEKFKKLKENSTALKNLFTDYELSNAHSIETLAGIFSVKESIIKALELEPGNWKDIEIIKKENGKPIVKINDLIDKTIISHDISISHDGEYVFSTSCFMINDIK